MFRAPIMPLRCGKEISYFTNQLRNYYIYVLSTTGLLQSHVTFYFVLITLAKLAAIDFS